MSEHGALATPATYPFWCGSAAFENQKSTLDLRNFRDFSELLQRNREFFTRFVKVRSPCVPRSGRFSAHT